jgi:integrase
LTNLRKRVNMWDAEAVKKIIDDAEWSSGYKELVETAYKDWMNFNGFDYVPRAYEREHKLPFIPLERDLDCLIAGFKGKYACVLQIMKETGASITETLRIRVGDVDLHRQSLKINYPTKGHATGEYRISNNLVSMIIRQLHGKTPTQRIWNQKTRNFCRNFVKRRKRIAEKLGNPDILRVSTKTFRHFKGTIEYHRTKDILHVQKVLRHKSLKNTLVYTHLVNWEKDVWVCKVASSLEEAVNLIEAGFEYVTEYEGKKIFRKRR